MLDVSSIEVMRPLLKRPSVVIMENCGHVPMVERPEKPRSTRPSSTAYGTPRWPVADANRRLGAVREREPSRDGSDPASGLDQVAICTSGLTSCS